MSLFNRVLRGRSPHGKHAHVDPHSWRLPSSYSLPKRDAKQTVIPNPRIFGGAIIPDKPRKHDLESALVYPDVSHAAVHLALLECFWNLRLGASSLDVQVSMPPRYEEKPHTHSATPTKPAESEKWDLLISLAVTRFGVWWSNLDDVLKHAAAYSHRAGNDVAVQLSKDQLPPLDVLLVWYVFILNRDAYRAACSSNTRLQQLCFPWPAIRECIDMERMQYTLTRPAEILFSTLSQQSADILAYLEQPPAYTDSLTTNFGVDLAAQIKLHEQFINDSHSLLWIRAPSLVGSLDRASASYVDFLLHQGPKKASFGKKFLPFGVALLWRTHQLFPSFYDLFLDEVQKLDNKADSEDLSETKNFAASSNPLHPQNICECWTCERIRDDLADFVFPFSSPNSSSFTSASSLSSANAGAALSASNHKMETNPIAALPSSAIRQIQDDLGFHEAVEAARRRGDPVLPTRPPTAAEKAAEKELQEKQKAVGYLPGLGEYWEVQPDGTRKIKRQKNMKPWGNSSVWAVGEF
ncbi:hypothetical protein QBC42DRAFT_259244 [Cladorrhinum samala]|uniref:Uncharacterized protein n=1 Tax=Cladorrhinum samala TaxID=585594 RepID=A0AAV9I0J5_9PEZI|nr:hypothetical protein QBC42DRAFT_259244 [Cladorrhinum samala]